MGFYAQLPSQRRATPPEWKSKGVGLGRSNPKRGDHRLKVACNDYFGAQGAEPPDPVGAGHALGATKGVVSVRFKSAALSRALNVAS